MTLYLIDLNVLQEMGPKGNAHVRAWLKTIDDDALRLSAITFYEKREGLERERKRRIAKAQATTEIQKSLAQIAALERLYADRVIPIGLEEVAEWARLMGAKGKNDKDTALAATARVNDLIIVTRNVKDFKGRGVRVLNPFVATPTITEV